MKKFLRVGLLVLVFLVVMGAGFLLLYYPPNILSRQITGYMAPCLIFGSLCFMAGAGVWSMLTHAKEQE